MGSISEMAWYDAPMRCLVSLLARVTVCLLLTATVVSAAEPSGAPVLEPPDTLRLEGVPPIPVSVKDALAPYEDLRRAILEDWHPTERRLLIRTRFADTFQLHELDRPGGVRTQVTFFDARVPFGTYRPGRPAQILFTLDEAGKPLSDLWLLDRKTARERLIFDGGEGVLGDPLWSPDGDRVAFTHTVRNGTDFDLWVLDPDGEAPTRPAAELEGRWFVTAWSPDGERILLTERVSSLESRLHMFDRDDGSLTPVAGHEPDHAPEWSGGEIAPDGRTLYTLATEEYRHLVRLDLETGKIEPLTPQLPADVERFDLSDDGTVLAFFVNQDGASQLYLMHTRSGYGLPRPELPVGEAYGLEIRPGGREVAFAIHWAGSFGDVFTWDPIHRRFVRWTESETGILPPESFTEARVARFPTFDEAAPGTPRTLTAVVYPPDPQRHSGPRPVLLWIHGGPSDQARPGFLGSLAYLVQELGIAVVYPNVRGSTGFGAGFEALDDGRLREDAVSDVGAVLDWIESEPGLDASRVMAAGGSYGGFLALRALTDYPQRLQCGFSWAGIVDFVSFLETTRDDRADDRRREYGDERDPEMRKFLRDISPLNRAAQIGAPLLVAAGANDTVVPVSQADLLVERVRAEGVEVWYVVAENEGHAYRRKSNLDYLRPVLVEFIRRCLAPSEATGPDAG